MQGVAVHWEGVSSEPADHSGCPAQWEGIKAYHARVGYGPNTAYNFGVCFHGEVFVGRGWDVRSAANGAGVPYNATHYAVCWFGGVNTSPPSDAAKAGIRGLLDQAAAREGATDWIAHSDCVPTMCPGDDLRNWVHAGAPVAAIPVPPDTSFAEFLTLCQKDDDDMEKFAEVTLSDGRTVTAIRGTDSGVYYRILGVDGNYESGWLQVPGAVRFTPTLLAWGEGVCRMKAVGMDWGAYEAVLVGGSPTFGPLIPMGGAVAGLGAY